MDPCALPASGPSPDSGAGTGFGRAVDRLLDRVWPKKHPTESQQERRQRQRRLDRRVVGGVVVVGLLMILIGNRLLAKALVAATGRNSWVQFGFGLALVTTAFPLGVLAERSVRGVQRPERLRRRRVVGAGLLGGLAFLISPVSRGPVAFGAERYAPLIGLGVLVGLILNLIFWVGLAGRVLGPLGYLPPVFDPIRRSRKTTKKSLKAAATNPAYSDWMGVYRETRDVSKTDDHFTEQLWRRGLAAPARPEGLDPDTSVLRTTHLIKQLRRDGQRGKALELQELQLAAMQSASRALRPPGA